jgi:peptide/nickel transport system permease protein
MAEQRAIAREEAITAAELARARSLWSRVSSGILKFIRQKPLGAFGAAVLLAMLVMAVAAPLVAPYDPLAVEPVDKLKGPSSSHIMGTDHLGRDMFSRVVYGARPSLYTGFMVVIITTILGVGLGVTSAYVGGVFDLLVQRVVDGLMAFPGLIFAMALLAVFSSGIHIGPINAPLVWDNEHWWAPKIPLMVVVALIVLFTPASSRIVRGATFSIMNNQYIEAAKAVGASPFRIILRHLVPNVMAPVIVIATIQLGAVILVESSLSFLGLGLPPPNPSWGGMLQGNGRRYMEVAPWLAIFPGLAISLGVLAFNLLGDALRDVLDPRMRGSVSGASVGRG